MTHGYCFNQRLAIAKKKYWKPRKIETLPNTKTLQRHTKPQKPTIGVDGKARHGLLHGLPDPDQFNVAVETARERHEEPI